MARFESGSGNSCFLWHDLWGDVILAQSFPELYSFAKKKNITLAEGTSQLPLHTLFHLPMSTQAHSQMLQLQILIEHANLGETSDKWTYIWNSSNFTVKQAYSHLRGQIIAHPFFKWLWASSCQSKHKVFFWLVLKDRLSTRELLRRKIMFLPDYTCVLCNGSEDESLFHLLLDCPFARDCWAMVNI
jgi:hypothetical protein